MHTFIEPVLRLVFFGFPWNPSVSYVVVCGLYLLGLLDVPLDDGACWLVLRGVFIFGVADACCTRALWVWGVSLLWLCICESSWAMAWLYSSSGVSVDSDSEPSDSE